MTETEGEQMRGSRSAHGVRNAAQRGNHASDMEDGLPTAHNPWPMAAGEAAVSDGTSLVPTDVVTAQEHAAMPPHHAAVTISAGSDPALTLTAQELTLANVLTPAEHTAIGNATPHHLPVALGAGSDPALALDGQTLTLTLPVGGGGLALQLTRVATGVAGETNMALDSALGSTGPTHVHSEFPGGQHAAVNAINGVIADVPGGEWASNGGGIAAWIRINFDRPVLLHRIELYDRINTTDNWGAGVIEFSDLSTLSFTAPPTNGAMHSLPVSPPRLTSSIRISQTSGGAGSNRGFAEIRAFEQMVVVCGLRARQTVRLMTAGGVEQLSATCLWEHTFVLFPLPSFPFNGYITVTRANGTTAQATSPTYADIMPGDVFALEAI